MAQYKTNFEKTKEFELKVRQFNVKKEINDAMRTVIEDQFLDFLTDIIIRKGLYADRVDRGRGRHHLSDTDAWVVKNDKNMEFVIKTKPVYAERAYYLEYGTSDVTPDGDALKFKPKPYMDVSRDEDGYIYRDRVDGVREYKFFRQAIQRFNTSQRVKEEFEGEISKRVESALSLR